ncbi:unnamed protein product [Boreogadus saida]
MATAFTAPSDPVSELLCSPSSRRSFGEKTDLISRGRPTPKPDGLTQAGKGFLRHFTECNYSRYDSSAPDCGPQIEEELNVGGVKRLTPPTCKENSARRSRS